MHLGRGRRLVHGGRNREGDRRTATAQEEGIDVEDRGFAFPVGVGHLYAQMPTPVNKEFLLAAETVIGDADGIDETASNGVYSNQMQETRSDYGTLGRLASTDIERQIVAEAGKLLFVTDTCHL